MVVTVKSGWSTSRVGESNMSDPVKLFVGEERKDVEFKDNEDP
jgi:hypothetical protein